MQQSNEENKTYQIFHNDVSMEKLFENYLNLEIESNKVIEMKKKK